MSDYNRIANLEAENTRLRSLVKELTGVLCDCIEGFDVVYNEECVTYGTEDVYKNANRLVSKAREAVK